MNQAEFNRRQFFAMMGAATAASGFGTMAKN
jgi:hypothetical protein